MGLTTSGPLVIMARHQASRCTWTRATAAVVRRSFSYIFETPAGQPTIRRFSIDKQDRQRARRLTLEGPGGRHRTPCRSSSSPWRDRQRSAIVSTMSPTRRISTPSRKPAAPPSKDLDTLGRSTRCATHLIPAISRSTEALDWIATMRAAPRHPDQPPHRHGLRSAEDQRLPPQCRAGLRWDEARSLTQEGRTPAPASDTAFRFHNIDYANYGWGRKRNSASKRAIRALAEDSGIWTRRRNLWKTALFLRGLRHEKHANAVANHGGG